MKVRVVEFLLDLFPHMVEDVFALGLRLVFIFTGIADALAFSAIDTHLGNAASGADVDIFSVRGRNEAVHSLL